MISAKWNDSSTGMAARISVPIPIVMSNAASEAWVTKRPIWVIEDSEEDFAVLGSSLRIAGVTNELIRSGTGREVADYLYAAASFSPAKLPILILLDLNIPGGDGRSILSDLRAHPCLRSIPAVVLTTSSQPGDVEKCYRLGASGYLTKSEDLDSFETMIRKMSDYWLTCVQLPRFTPSS